jgi:anti-sigma28 factor (negative regulator of flagellin synthesis)
MAGIQGIGGVPEPTPERPATTREKRRTDAPAQPSRDGVSISSEAQQAATVNRLTQTPALEQDIRADKVEGAKQALEQGNHKELDVLREVARNLLKFME